jgi:hypothetical protein
MPRGAGVRAAGDTELFATGGEKRRRNLLVQVYSRAWHYNDMYGDILSGIRTVFHRGLCTDGEFAFDFGLVIHQELNGVYVFALGDFKSERRVINRRDFSRQRLVVGSRLWVVGYQPVGNRRGPSSDGETGKKQSG